MQFTSFLLVGVSLLGATLAQSNIAFTTLPSSVQVGEPFVLRWGGGNDNQPVSITLEQGPSNNLTFVDNVATNVRGTSFRWVPKSYPDGEYALHITQGLDGNNYSGMFALSGGTSASATSASSTSSSASTTSATSLTPVVVPNGNGTASGSNSTSNSTMTTTALLPGTGIVASGGSSAATGTAMHRNTTMSMATLTSSRTTSTGPASTSAAATTAGGSTAGSTAAPTGAAVQVGSPIALILSVFAAFVYLG